MKETKRLKVEILGRSEKQWKNCRKRQLHKDLLQPWDQGWQRSSNEDFKQLIRFLQTLLGSFGLHSCSQILFATLPKCTCFKCKLQPQTRWKTKCNISTENYKPLWSTKNRWNGPCDGASKSKSRQASTWQLSRAFRARTWKVRSGSNGATLMNQSLRTHGWKNPGIATIIGYTQKNNAEIKSFFLCPTVLSKNENKLQIVLHRRLSDCANDYQPVVLTSDMNSRKVQSLPEKKCKQLNVPYELG